MQGFVSFFKSLGAARIAAMAAVTARADRLFRLPDRARRPRRRWSPLFTDLSVEDSAAIVKDLERQAIPYELKNDGAIVLVPKDKVAAAAHEARRRRPAQGRRRRLRDLRQVRRARRHQLRAEHQSPARARRRARPHHPRHRPGAGGARASRAARTAAVLARQGRALGLDRAEGARHARAAAGARDPPSGRLRGQRPEAAAGLDRRRNRPAARRRRRRRQSPAASTPTSARSPTSGACASRSKRSSPRWSARAAPACSSPPISTSTASPRPRTNSIPRAASCARARRAKRSSANGDASDGPVSVGNELPGAPAPAGRGASGSRATRTARPRKSSTTRFRAPPRPR